MSKVAVVYWSGTGNTEKMAEAVADGIKNGGGEAKLFQASDFKSDMVGEFDAIAFGCPSMGAEELEETEFEPMFSECESEIKDKNIVLFGSYDWGDGEWMDEWQETCKSNGANLLADGLICHETPDDEGIEECKALGEIIAKA